MTGDAAAGSRPPDAGMETEAQRRSGWLKWRKITRLSRGALEERAEWRAAPCASVRGLGAGGFLTCKTPDETTYFAISSAKRNGTDQKRRGLRTPQGQNLLRKCNNLGLRQNVARALPPHHGACEEYVCSFRKLPVQRCAPLQHPASRDFEACTFTTAVKNY